MKYSLIETLMGFSVILVAILFLFFGFSLEKNISSKNISISAVFENVTGLSNLIRAMSYSTEIGYVPL